MTDEERDTLKSNLTYMEEYYPKTLEQLRLDGLRLADRAQCLRDTKATMQKMRKLLGEL